MDDVQRKQTEGDIRRLAIECGKAKDEVERLRTGIQNFLNGDYEPRVKKTDKCPHGQYGYESCEACIELWFHGLLHGVLEQSARDSQGE